MNYPFWQLPGIGGGLLIAIIAVLHVYIAHLAVGGGLFLVWTERKARQEGREDLLAYVKKHTRFFLLLTMVFGGVSGVGIWFIISLVHPGGTSLLIHNFVFGWAIEWTFFIGEIVALLIYHYLFDRLRPAVHLAMGWLYFAFAWLSLFIINGILSYMLTPGGWLETGDFWQGFFNPTFWPSLLFRTGMACSIAGIFGLVTASFARGGEPGRGLLRYNALWMLLPLAAVILGGFWYLGALPADTAENLRRLNPEALPFTKVFLGATALVFLGGLISLVRLPRGAQRAATVLILAIGLAWIGGFEYLREIARKPWVIHGHLYSNSVRPEQLDGLNREGFLAAAKWVQNREINEENRLAAGRELLVHQCLICHSLGGYNDLVEHTAELTGYGLLAQLRGQGRVNPYMPPFFGTDAEAEALAATISLELQGRESDGLDPYLDHPRCVAMGEIGFNHITPNEEKAFVRQLEIAAARDIPVIVMTGSAIVDDASRQRVLALGATCFMSKPFSVEDLIEEIETVLWEGGRHEGDDVG